MPRAQHMRVNAIKLQERVERLETQNRPLKRFGLTAIATISITCMMMGAARKNYVAFDWVSAYGFTIRDDRVRDGGGCAYDPTIGPYFYLNDEKGNKKVVITMEGAKGL